MKTCALIFILLSSISLAASIDSKPKKSRRPQTAKKWASQKLKKPPQLDRLTGLPVEPDGICQEGKTSIEGKCTPVKKENATQSAQ